MARHVTIVNAYHDSNKGDAAILLGAIDLVRRRWPGARITVVSRYSSADPRFGSAHRHLHAAEPGVQVVASPFPDSRVGSSRSWWALRALGTRTVFGRRAFLAARDLEQAVDIFGTSDLVVGVGGHYLFSNRTRPADWERLARFSLPHVIARDTQVRNLLLGHSLGPFHGRVGAGLARTLLGCVDELVLREPISLATVPSASQLTTVSIRPDCAFALEPPDPAFVESVLSRFGLERDGYLAVTLRTWGATDAQRSYLGELAQCLHRLLDRGLVPRVVVVAQCHGPDAAEDDRPISRALHALLRQGASTLIEDDLGPRELMALFGGARAMIGTRFHSVIFGLLSGTPPVSLSYFGPKSRGIMTAMGVGEFSLDLTGLDAARVEECAVALLRQHRRAELRARSDAFRAELRTEGLAGVARG